MSEENVGSISQDTPIDTSDTSGNQTGISTMPTVELISAEEVKDKKGSVKARPFKKYFDAVERIGMVNWIRSNLEKQSETSEPNRVVIAKVEDVSKEMGPEFENYGYLTLYQALKYVLFQYGIILSSGVHKDGTKLFMMREKRPGDKLAASYKYWEERAARSAEVKDEREAKLLDKLNTKRQKIREEKVSAREDIRKERDAMYEELRKERNTLYDELRKEKRTMTEQIKKYKNLLSKKSEKRLYMVEVFKINWKTLEWKLIKGKTAKTDDGLLDMVREYLSTPDVRYRIEVTEIENLPDIEEIEGEGIGVGEGVAEGIGAIANVDNHGSEELTKVETIGDTSIEGKVQEKEKINEITNPKISDDSIEKKAE